MNNINNSSVKSRSASTGEPLDWHQVCVSSGTRTQDPRRQVRQMCKQALQLLHYGTKGCPFRRCLAQYNLAAVGIQT